MKLLRAILASRKGRVVFAVLACYLVWQAWLSLAAPAKVVEGYPVGRERVNVLVTLSFPPERFHVQVFQGFGRVSGTQDNSIEVRNVKRTDLAAVARPYWVRRVEPLKEEGG
jgi:hypothetical protein